jgi:uracil-DNA glycosylase
MQDNIDIIKKTLLEDFKSSGWDTILNPFLESIAFNDLTDKLIASVSEDRRFTPKFKDTFRPFKETKFKDLKVILVNQTPYPRFGVADGLAFSCSNTNIEEPSLKYMFDYIEKNSTDLKGEYKRDTDLTRWANQGVLLINSALTCEINKMDSHLGIWKPFIEYLFEMIHRENKDIIFVLMGIKAEHWQSKLQGQKILKCAHPASAAYKDRKWKALDIFNNINKELDKQGKDCISW